MSIEAVLLADAHRCAAIVYRDFVKLADILDDHLIHIHATGYCDSKQSYIAGLRNRLEVRSIDWEVPEVHLYGDLAIVNGALTNTVRSLGGTSDWMTGDSFVTQIWISRRGAWRLLRYHACRRKMGDS